MILSLRRALCARVAGRCGRIVLRRFVPQQLLKQKRQRIRPNLVRLPGLPSAIPVDRRHQRHVVIPRQDAHHDDGRARSVPWRSPIVSGATNRRFSCHRRKSIGRHATIPGPAASGASRSFWGRSVHRNTPLKRRSIGMEHLPHSRPALPVKRKPALTR